LHARATGDEERRHHRDRPDFDIDIKLLSPGGRRNSTALADRATPYDCETRHRSCG
jgi:hypothetical protein